MSRLVTSRLQKNALDADRCIACGKVGAHHVAVVGEYVTMTIQGKEYPGVVSKVDDRGTTIKLEDGRILQLPPSQKLAAISKERALEIVQKLEAHADSAAKIGNPEEAKTFEDKAKTLRKQYDLDQPGSPIANPESKEDWIKSPSEGKRIHRRCPNCDHELKVKPYTNPTVPPDEAYMTYCDNLSCDFEEEFGAPKKQKPPRPTWEETEGYKRLEAGPPYGPCPDCGSKKVYHTSKQDWDFTDSKTYDKIDTVHCSKCQAYWPFRKTNVHASKAAIKNPIHKIEEEERKRRNNIPEIFLGLDVAENLAKQRKAPSTGLRRRPDYGENDSYTSEMNEANKAAGQASAETYMKVWASTLKERIPLDFPGDFLAQSQAAAEYSQENPDVLVSVLLYEEGVTTIDRYVAGQLKTTDEIEGEFGKQAAIENPSNPDSIAKSLAEAGKQVAERKARVDAALTKAPDGYMIGKYEKFTYQGDVFFVRKNKGYTPGQLLEELGEKAVMPHVEKFEKEGLKLSRLMTYRAGKKTNAGKKQAVVDEALKQLVVLHDKLFNDPRRENPNGHFIKQQHEGLEQLYKGLLPYAETKGIQGFLDEAKTCLENANRYYYEQRNAEMALSSQEIALVYLHESLIRLEATPKRGSLEKEAGPFTNKVLLPAALGLGMLAPGARETKPSKPPTPITQVEAPVAQPLDPADVTAALRTASKATGIPFAALSAIAHNETHYGQDTSSSGNSNGLMQMTPDALSEVNKIYGTDYTIEDMNDPDTAALAAAKYLHILLKKFDKNLDATIAAYNTGATHVNAVLAEYGEVTPETLAAAGHTTASNYLTKAKARMSPKAGSLKTATLPRFVYHGTDKSNLESIRKTGLKSGITEGEGEGDYPLIPGQVYVTTSLQDAELVVDGLPDPIVLKIDTHHPKLKGTKWKSDKNNPGMSFMTKFISPEAIVEVVKPREIPSRKRSGHWNERGFWIYDDEPKTANDLRAFPKGTRYVFHGTSEEAVKSILKQGLGLLSTEAYVTTDPGLAESFGEGVLLKIDLKSHSLRTAVWEADEDSEVVFKTHSRIPASAIVDVRRYHVKTAGPVGQDVFPDGAIDFFEPVRDMHSVEVDPEVKAKQLNIDTTYNDLHQPGMPVGASVSRLLAARSKVGKQPPGMIYSPLTKKLMTLHDKIQDDPMRAAALFSSQHGDPLLCRRGYNAVHSQMIELARLVSLKLPHTRHGVNHADTVKDQLANSEKLAADGEYRRAVSSDDIALNYLHRTIFHWNDKGVPKEELVTASGEQKLLPERVPFRAEDEDLPEEFFSDKPFDVQRREKAPTWEPEYKGVPQTMVSRLIATRQQRQNERFLKKDAAPHKRVADYDEMNAAKLWEALDFIKAHHGVDCSKMNSKEVIKVLGTHDTSLIPYIEAWQAKQTGKFAAKRQRVLPKAELLIWSVPRLMGEDGPFIRTTGFWGSESEKILRHLKELGISESNKIPGDELPALMERLYDKLSSDPELIVSEGESNVMPGTKEITVKVAKTHTAKTAGASDFSAVGKGKTVQEAFRNATDEARHESGHEGYSGTIAEKGSYVVLNPPKGIKPLKWAEWVMSGTFGPEEQLKDHRQVEYTDGQKCPQRTYTMDGKSSKTCPGTISLKSEQVTYSGSTWTERKPKCSAGHHVSYQSKGTGENAKFYYSKAYPMKPEYISQIRSDAQRVNDKWGPAGAVQLSGDKWYFFGYASS